MSVTRWKKFSEWAKQHKKIAIVGGPKAGKTTLSLAVKDRHVLHTDDYINMDWDRVPQQIIDDLAEHDTFLVEGVQAARALRKGLKVDVIVATKLPSSTGIFRKDGQARMAKAVKRWMEGVDKGIPLVKIEEILE